MLAADAARGIGKANGLPWPKLPADLDHFKHVTTDTADPARRNAVVMGRKTWDSVPARWRPLSGRLNVVVSRARPELPSGVLLATSLDDAIAQATAAGVEGIFVVGGAQIYDEAMRDRRCAILYWTDVRGTFEADAHVPSPRALGFTLDAASDVIRDAAVEYVIERWRR